MRNKGMRWLRYIVAFVLVIAMLLPMTPPMSAYAAENDLYLAYQTDENGEDITKYETIGNQLGYEVTELCLNVGDKVDLCFISTFYCIKSQWTSSDNSVLQVNNKGVITAVSEGIANVTLTCYTWWGRKFSASAKIYVGESNWNLEIGVHSMLTSVEEYRLKVGEDIILNVYGMGELKSGGPINMEWNCSDEAIVGISSRYSLEQRVWAKKEGTAILTVKIKNEVLNSVITRSVKIAVTKPAYTSSDEWDNPYYLLYGENYKRLFSSKFLAATEEIERDILNPAWDIVRNEMNTVGLSAFTELTDLKNGLTIGWEGALNGMDYEVQEGHRQAALYLVQELTADKRVNAKYTDRLTKALEKADGLFKEFDNIHSLSDAIKKVEKAGLAIEKKEATTILDYILNDAAGDISDGLSEGVTMSEYIALALCLYELDTKFLDDLQKCSEPGEALYEDIELIKQAKAEKPIEFFIIKYGKDLMARGVSEILLEMLDESTTKYIDAADKLISMYVDMAGVSELSEITKAVYLMEYMAAVSSKITELRVEIETNFDSYTDKELIEKIEEYEFVYSTYLTMIEPVIKAVEKLEQYGYNAELSVDAAIPSGGYDYGRHIATAMCAYLEANADVDEYTKIKDETLKVQEKMDVLLKRLGVIDGKIIYFTANQKACSTTRLSLHGCANCNMRDIATTDWFTKIFGKIDVDNFPTHDVNSSRRDHTGQSCFGFACFAQWYLYADDITEKVEGKRIATVAFDKANIEKYVKPGDVIRINGHSVLVYGLEENGVMVIDCNWNKGGQLNCLVQKHLLAYENVNYKGYTAYINRVTKVENMEEGKAGLFDIKNIEYIADEKVEYTNYASGTLDLSGTSWSIYNVGLNKEMYADKEYSLRHGAKLRLLEKCVNSKGNTVYHVYSEDLRMECYITAKYVKESVVTETLTPTATPKSTNMPVPTATPKPTNTPMPTVTPAPIVEDNSIVEMNLASDCFTYEMKNYEYVCTGLSEKGYAEFQKYDNSNLVKIKLPSVSAEGKEVIGFYSNSKEGYDLKELLTKDSAYVELVCPESYTKYYGVCDERPSVKYADKLKKVILNDGLEVIESSAFYGCTGLTSINIPESVTTFGNSVFDGCEKLVIEEFEMSGKSFGSWVFSDVTIQKLKISGDVEIERNTPLHSTIVGTVEFAEDLDEIPEGIFQYCYSLKMVDIPSSVIRIGDNAFGQCTGLKNIELPSSVEEIGSGAFRGCTNLKSVELTENVDTIESAAFYGCTSLTDIKIPESVTTFGNSAFDGCEKLVIEEFEMNGKSFGSWVFSDVTIQKLKISGDVEIERNTPLHSTIVKNVELAGGLKEIPDCLFMYCKSIKTITIPDSVVKIGISAFSNCTKLESVFIPTTVEKIGGGAFSNCEKLVIITPSGSVAEQYAIENDIPVQNK